VFEREKGGRLNVFLCGSAAMKAELAARHVSVFGDGPDGRFSDLSSHNLDLIKLDESVTHVLFGFDEHFSHSKAALACSYIKSGAKLIVTNMDEQLPVSRPDLLVPDVGSLIQAIGHILRSLRILQAYRGNNNAKTVVVALHEGNGKSRCSHHRSFSIG